MKVGLFFGSFNPIHIGHLIIANTIVESAAVDKVWFVVSPQSPFKKKEDLAHEFDRLDMVRLAIAENPNFNVTDIEFSMPKPSFTVDTLTYLREKYPKNKFYLIIGEDNLRTFHKWKNHEEILKHHSLIVYPRPSGKDSNFEKPEGTIEVKAPLLDVSATFIRKSINQGKSVKYLLQEDVITYVRRKKLYQS